MLDGKALPYVDHLDHLGHVLHKSMSMEMDCARATKSFKRRARDLRDQLHFCQPRQVMKLVNTYVGDCYGSNLWRLDSAYANSFYSRWNVTARNVFDVRFDSHVNVVEGFLCKDITSLKQQVLSRYPKFVRKLLDSTSKEVQFLSRIVLNDQRSNTCRNICYLSDATNLNNVIMVAGWRIRQALKEKCTLEPWRKNLLETFMKIKYEKTHEDFGMTKQLLNDFIDSLLIS